MKTESSKEMLGKLQKPTGEMGSQHSKSCSSSSAIALLSLVLNLNTTNHTEDAIVMVIGFIFQGRDTVPLIELATKILFCTHQVFVILSIQSKLSVCAVVLLAVDQAPLYQVQGKLSFQKFVFQTYQVENRIRCYVSKIMYIPTHTHTHTHTHTYPLLNLLKFIFMLYFPLPCIHFPMDRSYYI